MNRNDVSFKTLPGTCHQQKSPVLLKLQYMFSLLLNCTVNLGIVKHSKYFIVVKLLHSCQYC